MILLAFQGRADSERFVLIGVAVVLVFADDLAHRRPCRNRRGRGGCFRHPGWQTCDPLVVSLFCQFEVFSAKRFPGAFSIDPRPPVQFVAGDVPIYAVGFPVPFFRAHFDSIIGTPGRLFAAYWYNNSNNSVVRIKEGTALSPCGTMARPLGLEPRTLCLEGRCSIQLSYGRCGDSIESSRDASSQIKGTASHVGLT